MPDPRVRTMSDFTPEVRFDDVSALFPRKHKARNMNVPRSVRRRDRAANCAQSDFGEGAMTSSAEFSRAAVSYTQDAQRDHVVTRRRVTFKTMLYPEVVPQSTDLPSYDELVFHVAGFQPAHAKVEPNEMEFGPLYDEYGREIHVERSMLVIIAEFLFRSAVYLGYQPENRSWLPYFRESKRFSSNDVKRWRRLAHHDWEQEERAAASSNGHGSFSLRAAVSGWIHRRRRHSAPASTTLRTKQLNAFPPTVSSSRDLSLLVTIINSCVSYGTFQFRAKDVRRLCNVDIEMVQLLNE